MTRPDFSRPVVFTGSSHPEILTARSRLKAWLVEQGMEERWPRWAVFVAINLLGLRGA